MAGAYVWSLAALMFGIELLMVAVFGYGGWALGGRGVVGWGAAVIAVATVVAMWALFASPTPVVDIGIVKLVVKVVLFAGAALILAVVAGRTDLAVVFAIASLLINLAALLPPYSNYGGFDVAHS